jgi:hypothetical protein
MARWLRFANPRRIANRVTAASRPSFRKALYTGFLVALVFASVGKLLTQFELNDIGSPLAAGWFAGIAAVVLMYLKPLVKEGLSDQHGVTQLNIFSSGETLHTGSWELTPSRAVMLVSAVVLFSAVEWFTSGLREHLTEHSIREIVASSSRDACTIGTRIQAGNLTNDEKTALLKTVTADIEKLKVTQVTPPADKDVPAAVRTIKLLAACQGLLVDGGQSNFLAMVLLQQGIAECRADQNNR